jgi:hypothetical protein
MNIDLNVQNYTNEELAQLFRLQPGYDASEIEKKENEIYIQLMKTVTDISTKSNITIFLKKGKDRLLELFQLNQPVKCNTYMLCIDSMLRHQYNLTKSYDFIYTLHEPIMAKSLQIDSIEIPVVWNTFNSSTFFIDKELIQIPDGYYSSDEFVEIVRPLIPIHISINKYTRFTSCESFTIEFDTKPLYKSCGWYMGFRKVHYTSVYNALESIYEIISDTHYGNINEQIIVELYDYCETFETDCSYSIMRQDINSFYYGKHIMARFPVKNQLMFVNGFPIRRYHSPIKLERIRIRLLNKLGDTFHLLTDFNINIKITI